MSVMFEIHYPVPADDRREARLQALLRHHGGELTCREEPLPDDVSQAVVLTIEFDSRETAELGAAAVRRCGEHVEGPMEYGD